MNRTIQIEHNGKTLHGTIMRIKSTSLTVEDHGIVTAWLHCEGDGTGVGVGGYCLDEPYKDENFKHLGRRGTAFGLDHLMQIMKTAGVGTWEKLPGLDVIVLYDGPGSVGRSPVGFAHIRDERKVLVFADHVAAWQTEDVAS